MLVGLEGIGIDPGWEKQRQMPMRATAVAATAGSFDYVAASLREAATPLRMTDLFGGASFGLDGRGCRLSTGISQWKKGHAFPHDPPRSESLSTNLD